MPTLSQKAIEQINQGVNPAKVKVIHKGGRYTNFTLRDGKPAAWRTDLLTGKSKFVNV